VDGTVGTGGCVFCNIRSFSPSRRLEGLSITAQIDAAIRRLRRPRGPKRFLAYFQPATNTYAPLERLRSAYEEAAGHSDMVGLIVGTRPDCVPDETLDLLAELGRRTWLVVEYGLQSIHERSLRWLGRGHDYAAFLDAVARTRARGLAFGVHLILGIPGEDREDMLATARAVAKSGAHSVKLHNLYAVRDTRLADLVGRGEVRLPDLGEFAAWAVDFLEVSSPDCVVDRLGSTAPPEFLIAPAWCLDKSAARKAVEAEFNRRDSWQGKERGEGRGEKGDRTERLS
jgi:radical SAM protein (TIGR01212 family)